MASEFASSFNKQDLLECARGALFGQGNAQLPEPPMLMMDRILEISDDRGTHGKGHVVAELISIQTFGFSNVIFLATP